MGSAGVTIVESTWVLMNRERAEAFYADHKDRDCFAEMVKSLTCGTNLAFRLRAPNAVSKWRALMGPADPEQAKQQAPDSIRAKFASSTIRNTTHGSDSVESARPGASKAAGT